MTEDKAIQNAGTNRRALLKGAAWAAPTAAMALGAPALAQSPTFTVGCEESAIPDALYASGLVGWTRVAGTKYGRGTNTSGSFFDMRFGQWQFGGGYRPSDPQGKRLDDVTGYRISWGKEIIIRSIVKDASGSPANPKRSEKYVAAPLDPAGHNTWTGTVGGAPNSGPLVIGAGLAYTGNSQTNMPYTASLLPDKIGYYGCGKDKVYKTLVVSVPVSFTFLKGLKKADSDTLNPTAESNSCGVYLNYVVDAGPSCTSYNLVGNSVGITRNGQAWASSGIPEFPGTFQ